MVVRRRGRRSGWLGQSFIPIVNYNTLGSALIKLSSDKLAKLVQSIDYFSHTDMVSNEANTKKKIVEPLLEVLGWDLLSNEVRLEQVIRVGTTSGHADYALMLEGKTVVLVEAKALASTKLTPSIRTSLCG